MFSSVLHKDYLRFSKSQPLFCRTFYVSVLTIFCFSWERYLAICHPLYLYTMAGTARTTRWAELIFWGLSQEYRVSKDRLPRGLVIFKPKNKVTDSLHWWPCVFGGHPILTEIEKFVSLYFSLTHYWWGSEKIALSSLIEWAWMDGWIS